MAKAWDSSGSSAAAGSSCCEIAALFLYCSLVRIVGSGGRLARLRLPAFSLDGSCIGVSSSPGCEGPGSPGSGLACIVPMYNVGGVCWSKI